MARNLDDPQAGSGDPDMHHRLDVEPVRVCRDEGEASAPEGVIAVAEVGVVGIVQQVHRRAEEAVAGASEPGEVVAPAPREVAGSLGEVRALDEGSDEPGNLIHIGRAVRVQGHDDVAPRGPESAEKRVALAATGLLKDDCVRSQLERNVRGSVAGTAIDDYYLVLPREPREDVQQVLRLVQGRYDDADSDSTPRGGFGGSGGSDDSTHRGPVGSVFHLGPARLLASERSGANSGPPALECG
jgi:hypothetical protein